LTKQPDAGQGRAYLLGLDGPGQQPSTGKNIKISFVGIIKYYILAFVSAIQRKLKDAQKESRRSIETREK
jgi:hypothetical protein